MIHLLDRSRSEGGRESVWESVCLSVCVCRVDGGCGVVNAGLNSEMSLLYSTVYQ